MQPSPSYFALLLCCTAKGCPVAMVRRSNSACPASRRPLPVDVLSVPGELACRSQILADGPGSISSESEQVWAGQADLWRSVSGVNCSQNGARLSGDSGHVSCKLNISFLPLERRALGRLLLWRRVCLCVCHVDVLCPND